MLANSNLKICRILVRQNFRFHRIRSLLLILSAALVTGLYSFVFLMGNSVEDALLLSYEYSYGSVSHILYTGMTEGQADMVAQNGEVKSTVRLSTIGQLSDPMMGQRLVKLAVTDREYAESVLSVPETGRLPREKGEIALDEFTMDSLGVSHELGASVSLLWTDPQGNSHTSDFTLCGWWNSSTNFTEACAWITEEAAEELSPGYQEETAHNVTLGVLLHQPKDTEAQAQEILDAQGVSGVSFTVNTAYQIAMRERAADQALPYYLPAAAVLICGYLMMYSIVHVAAQQDLLHFAGLKSLGMTPRQICHMLWAEGCAVSVLGLLPGWLLGFLLDLGITSRLIGGMGAYSALAFLTWKPFVLAGICTAATAFLAYLRPVLRLCRLTPAQTIENAMEKMPQPRKGSDGRTTLWTLAVRALRQERGRTFLSAVTLLLAALLLLAQWIQYISYREDLYLAGLSPWDYTLADGSAYLSMQRYNENNRGITGETVQELRNRPEVVKVSGLKSKEVTLTASDELRRRIVDYYNQPYDDTHTLRETQEGYTDWCQGLDRLEETGEYTALILGIEGDYLEYVLENSPFTSGSFDAEAFASGRYVLAGGASHEGISSPAQGETAVICGQSFEVLGSVMHDDTYLSGADSREAAFHIAYLLPAEVFDQLFPDQAYRQLAVQIHPERRASFEAYLDQYEQQLNRGVGITRKSEYRESFQTARLNSILPQLIVGLVLLGIAVLNFINLLIAKAVTRRQEFAVYESLGMTRAQLRRLLLTEGVLHGALMAAAVSLPAVCFARFAMPLILERKESWCLVYTFSLMPLWILLPVLLLLGIGVPLLCYCFLTRGSLTERMGTAQ